MEGCTSLCLSYRMLITAMCFMMFCCMQLFRLNMSVGIVCMINHTAILKENGGLNGSSQRPIIHRAGDKEFQYIKFNDTTSRPHFNDGEARGNVECKSRTIDEEVGDENEDGPFVWSKKDQGLIVGAYYWGYVFFTIPCGWLVNRFGSVKVIATSAFLSSAVTLLTPLAAWHGPTSLIVLRTVIGVTTAAFPPGIQNLLSQWMTHQEASRLTSTAYAGFAVGSLVTFSSSGLLCKYGFGDGWQSIFYIQGMFCLAVTIAWCILVRETPAIHPWVSPSEKIFLHTRVANKRKANEHRKIPWRGMLRSKPVYACFSAMIAIEVYGSVGVFFLPIYFADVMKFKIASNGLWSALPYAFLTVVQVIAGTFSDFLLKRSTLSKGNVRKIMTCSGMLISASAIFSVGFVDCDQPMVAVSVVVISVLPLSLLHFGCTVSPIDIAPSFSGPLVSVSSFLGNLLALGAVSLTTAIISQDASRHSWQIIFSIVAGVLLTACVFYFCFASGEVQSWAVVDKSDAANVELEDGDDISSEDRILQDGNNDDVMFPELI